MPKPDGKMAEERIHLDVLKATIAKVRATPLHTSRAAQM